jgi:hypothetical protein
MSSPGVPLRLTESEVTARLKVVPYATYKRPFEQSLRRFKWIAVFARIDFYGLLVVQATLTSLSTVSSGEIQSLYDQANLGSPTHTADTWSNVSLIVNLGSLIITAVLAAVPFQRVDVQCTQAASIISVYLMTKEAIPMTELKKVTAASTLCCLNPLRLETTDEGFCYWADCSC